MAYREFRPRAELSELVACTWEREAPTNGRWSATRVLPDGCVDLIWHTESLFVAGPDSRAFIGPPRPPGATIVGLRLRPGIAGQVLGLPARELRDARVPLQDVWGPPGAELNERLSAAAAASERRHLLEQTLLGHLSGNGKPDALVLAAVRQLGLPGSRVGSLTSELGTSERQLLRRFNSAVGYGPKTLDRVLRFQRFLAHAEVATNGDAGLARLAAEAGYADQAHLSRECARLSGLTPARLIASRAA
jgi:AraC-like DNA-binding protein